MDWSRAKTILIITFFILDLFLAAQLSQTMEQKSTLMETGTISREQIDQLLKENRIRLAEGRQAGFPSAIVAYQASITPMGPEWKKDELGGYSREFPDSPTFRSFDDLKAILSKTVPRFDEYRLSLSNGSRIVYNQQADGRNIFDATVEVRLKGGNRIESVRVVHYDLVKLKPVKLITLDMALYHLLTNWNLKKGSVITGVDLGYRAKAMEGAGEEFILVPYFRFRVENLPQDLFLNARGFSKEVEAEPRDAQIDGKGTK